MKYRRLGKTELRASVVGLGTWQFGGDWGKKFEQAEVNRIIDRARHLGVNFIDTAECYGDHISETFIGNAIHKTRGQWILATKFGHNHKGDLDKSEYFKAPEVARQLDASLKALKTDYIDIYQFHSGIDPYFGNDELWIYLDKQKQAGKILHLGVSIGKNDNMHQTGCCTDVGAEILQVAYNLINRVAANGVFQSCIDQDLGVINRVPLASGFLSGKYNEGQRWEEGDVRSLRNPEVLDAELRRCQKELEEVPQGVNRAAWALVWCLRQSAISTVVPGCKTIEQLEINVQAADLLTED